MSVNNSSGPQCPSSNTSLSLICLDHATYVTYWFISVVFVLPLSAFIIYVGFQRWKQQRSTTATMNHSDFFTFNMSGIELIGGSGYIVVIYGYFSGIQDLMWVGLYLSSVLWSGQMLFPVLTCVDRYLAAVHPIMYLKLRQRKAVCIRNISVVFIWLQGCTGPGFMVLSQKYIEYILGLVLGEIVIFLIVTLYCNLSVLHVLIRPRPGEAGGDRVHLHQMKKKAFRTITIIMGVLLMKFGGSLIGYSLLSSESVQVQCAANAATLWFSLPTSLVLPLLFLHREGKVPGCKHATETG